ncbi:MAG: hypothetical protein EXR69_08775 [Myxococcales bacterium]|nr:hypothetical protein [Myxococcales bacterium]
MLTLDDLVGDGVVLSRLDAPGVVLTLPAVVVETTNPPPGARSLGGNWWRVADDHPLARARALLAAGATDAFPDLIQHPTTRVTFDDPEYGGQWYLDELGMADLYDLSTGTPEVRLAVIDSGIDIAHTDLLAHVVAPYDAYSDDDDPSPDPGEYCTDGSDAVCDGHGTAVSGISAAIGNNGFGMVGLCPDCSLIPIKMLGEGAGVDSLATSIAAFQHAIDADAWVVNNSWGYTESTPVPRSLANIIEKVATENRGGLGAVVVFAAGNDDRELGDDEVEALETVLCVSATDSYGNATNYTNYGDAIDVAAPSATVSIAPGDMMTTTFGGTSAASPVVAGLAGWILSVAPDMSARTVRDLISSTAVQSPLVIPGEDGKSTYFGHGNISPATILAELFPTDGGDTGHDRSKACRCATSGSTSGPTSALLVGGLLTALTVRRRRSRTC